MFHFDADTTASLGQLLLGVGTVVAAVGAVVSARRSGAARDATHRVSTRVTEAATAAIGTRSVVDRVASSVGETNGETLTDLLHKVVRFEAYQHERNHDVLGKLSLVTSGVPLLLDQADVLRREFEVLRELVQAALDALDTAAGEDHGHDGDDGN